MENSLVSIIIPVYNSEKLLKKCLDSVLNQTYKNIEVIIINDGSSDNSYDICLEYSLKDDRIIFLTQENSGVSSSRNSGIRKSTGDYIMFVDSDDFIDKDMVETLLKYAKKYSVDYVVSGLYVDFVDSNNNKKYSIKNFLDFKLIDTNDSNFPDNIIDLVESEKISGPCAKLIRRNILIKNNIFMPENITLQEDLYFNVKILENISKMIVINEVFYHYVKTKNESITTRYYENRYEMVNEVHNLLFNFYYKRTKEKSVLERICYLHIKNTVASFMNLFHKNCKKTRTDKIKYISYILDSEKYNYMVDNANRIGIKYKVILLIAKTKNKFIMYYFSKLFNIMKFRFNIRF